MLIVTRLLFALIFSVGLANSVFASPMAIDIVRANPKDNAIEVMLASQAAFIQVEANTSLQAIQNNHPTLENVKQKPGKVSKVAEPSSIILLCLGLLGLGFLRRRKH
ncbi:MAG: PEP-CTERM sorting domain-containing protein [Pseudomonadota bacterium]